MGGSKAVLLGSRQSFPVGPDLTLTSFHQAQTGPCVMWGPRPQGELIAMPTPRLGFPSINNIEENPPFLEGP